MCLLQYVHGSLEDPKTLTHHKLIHAATERILTESKTVSEENLKDKGNEHSLKKEEAAYRVLLGFNNLHDFSKSGKHAFKMRLPHISRFFCFVFLKKKIILISF